MAEFLRENSELFTGERKPVALLGALIGTKLLAKVRSKRIKIGISGHESNYEFGTNPYWVLMLNGESHYGITTNWVSDPVEVLKGICVEISTEEIFHINELMLNSHDFDFQYFVAPGC